jgi:uncharacterized membrane protein YqiK
MVIGGLGFYLRGVKYFTPSEIVAIPIPTINTGEIDEDGNPITTNYRIIRNGGYTFLPFWRKYYVLPANRINTKITSDNILTKDELRISVNIITQYKIDTETDERTTRAFHAHSFLLKKMTSEESTKIISEYYKDLILGVIPELIGKMEIKKLIHEREDANIHLTKLLQRAFQKYGLLVDNVKITNIQIENKMYFESLESRVGQEEQIKELDVKMRKEDAELNYEKRAEERGKELDKVKYEREKKQLELSNDLEIDKINANQKMMKHQKEVEEYNRNSILVKERAKKDAELILQKLNLQIAELKNKAQHLYDTTEVDRIEAINSAMSKTNGYASMLIMLERNPNLIKQLFGKNGLSRFANSITQHLANIESLNITDFSGGGKDGGIGALERFGYMIPTLFSQTISKLNKIGIAQSLTDIGVDKEAIKNLKKNRKLVEEFKTIGQKIGIEDSDRLIDEFFDDEPNIKEESVDKDEDTAEDKQESDIVNETPAEKKDTPIDVVKKMFTNPLSNNKESIDDKSDKTPQKG